MRGPRLSVTVKILGIRKQAPHFLPSYDAVNDQAGPYGVDSYYRIAM
jgi:hypothetical protein